MKKVTALLFAVALTLSMSSLSFAQDAGSGDKKMDDKKMDKMDKKEKKEKKHKKEKKEKKEKKDDAKGGEMK
jgi:Spy/CpxP family protein refolding chaperone